jgi:hypothetical protein
VVGVSDDLERAISETAYGRRTFLRRLVVGSAFAVPVVSSFSMAGINAVSANATPQLNNCNTTIGNLNTTTTIGNLNTTDGCNPDPYCANSNSNQKDGLLGQLEEIFELFKHGHK